MPVVEESVFINRPPEEVFDFLVKTENIPVWDTSVIQAEQVGDGPVALGTRLKGTSKILGRHLSLIPGQCTTVILHLLRGLLGSVENTLWSDGDQVLSLSKVKVPCVAGAQTSGVRGGITDSHATAAGLTGNRSRGRDSTGVFLAQGVPSSPSSR